MRHYENVQTLVEAGVGNSDEAAESTPQKACAEARREHTIHHETKKARAVCGNRIRGFLAQVFGT